MSSGFKMKGSAFYGKKVSYGPAKQGQVNPARPEYRPTAAGEEQMLAAEGAIKQVAPKQNINKEEAYAARAGGPTESPMEKSPNKQGTQFNPAEVDMTQDEYSAHMAKLAMKREKARGRKAVPGGSPTTKKSPAKADPTWDEWKNKYDSYAAYKNMRKNAGLKANPNNPNA